MKTRLIPTVLFGLSSALPSTWAQSPETASTPAAAPAPAAHAPETIKEVAPAPEATASAPVTLAQPAAPATLAEGGAAAAVPGPAVKNGKETLTVDFADDDIRTILRNVADLFDLNLVIPETLQGKASIKLRDVTWRQIFKVLLGPVNYTYVEDGNIIRIVTADSLNQEPAITEIFVLNYAKAVDVKPSIDNLVDAKAGGKIVVDSRSNSLLVSERPSVIARIRPIVNHLDRATDQVMIETKFIDVTQGDVKNLGVNWSSLANYKVGTEGPIKRKYDQTDGSTNTNGTKTGTTNGTSSSRSSKNTDPTYLISETNKVNGMLGTNLPPVPFTEAKDVSGNGIVRTWDAGATSLDGSSAGTSASNDITNLVSSNLSKVTSAVLSADQFSLILSALNTLDKSRLVSNPTVVTLNNMEASINIGRDYPIPNYTYNQERGVFEVSGFNYKSIGVNLKVTPQVNTAGFIRLSVEPEVSSSNESVSFGGSSGASIPIIQVRRTKTQITLKDGYTLGIGGLVERTTSNSENKVPVLGDIPGLGRLFRSKSTSIADHNLVVFITAKTIKPDGADTGEIFDPRITRQMELQKDDLPGFRDGSDPYFHPAPPEEKKKK